jgi:hypothetical protein
MVKTCSTYEREGECLQDFGGKSRSEITTRKTNECVWVDSIKIDLREIGLDCMNWIDFAQSMDQ